MQFDRGRSKGNSEERQRKSSEGRADAGRNSAKEGKSSHQVSLCQDRGAGYQ